MKEKIFELIKINRSYGLSDSSVVSQIALCIAKSGDSSLFSILPQPIKGYVIEHGLSVSDHWMEISSSGTEDLSEFAPVLNKLSREYMASVPLGEYMHFNNRKNT